MHSTYTMQITEPVLRPPGGGIQATSWSSSNR